MITKGDWKNPQLCCDCRCETYDGWQELKYSGGGPYLEKRCGPCAEAHYGKTLPELADDLSKKKRRSGQTKATDKKMMTEAPLLGLTG